MAQDINLEDFIISCQAKKERKSLDAEIDNYEELSGERSFLEVSSAEALNDTDDTLCVYDSNNWAFDVESTRATFYIGNRGEIINKKTGTTPRSASFASLNLSEESSSLQFNLPPPSVENAYKKRKFVDFRELTCEDVRRGFTKSGNCDEGYNIKLSVANRGLKDLRSVSNFTNLTEIDVSGNYLKCVRALGVMQYLENLNASSNDIETFLDICPIPLGLKEVDFSKNCISKILNLKPFWTLTDINLSYNSLTEMEIEDPMYYLKSLDLSHNMITKVNLNCPNLFILNLKSNCLNAIEGLEHCSNLCSLNLARNQISELGSLKYFGSLVELHIERNNIADLYELETLKALLYLHCLWVHHNKISFLEYSRLMFIHTLPQLLSLDGKKISIQEMRDAKNIFNPSSIKLSCLDHTNTLVDRACQPSNVMYETFCQCTSSAPIILIVGTEQSECHKLALLLKEEFRTSVHLGGVHSTAATMEGSNRDIPITLEAFAEMKNRGDFLTTSHILGRICGFSSSQISRATERRAILVASVPLGTAISIRKWKIQSKIVLVLPSTPLIISHGEKERTLVEYQNIIEDEQELESEEEQNSEEEEEDSLEEDDFMEEQRDSIEGEDIADEKSEMVYDQLNSTEIDDIGEKLQVAYANMDTMELFGYDDDPMRYLQHRASTDESEDTSNKDKKTPEETKDSNEAHDFTEEQKDLDNDGAEEQSKNSSSEENDDEEEGECDDYSVESESEPSLESSSKDEIQIEEEVSDEKEEDECHEVFDLEYYKFKDKEALAESINKTRELYAEFHRENPDFFQEPLDTPDVCYSYALLLYELQTKDNALIML